MTNQTQKNRSFIINKGDLFILDCLSDKQAGELLKAIVYFVNNDKINITDPILLTPLLKIKENIIKGWNRAYIKNGKKRYHWNWKGGITPKNHSIRQSTEYKIWRNKVFERDYYTCQECLQTGVILHAHHIKHFASYPELRFNLCNGLTLCKICHNKKHSKGEQND